MKKRVYILPHSPSPEQLRQELSKFSPAITEKLSERVLDSFSTIQSRLRTVPVNDTRYSVHQTQTFSDANHTITLIGALTEPTVPQKILRWL